MIIWQEITDGVVSGYFTDAGDVYTLPEIHEANPLAKMNMQRPAWAVDSRDYMNLELTAIEE